MLETFGSAISYIGYDSGDSFAKMVFKYTGEPLDISTGEDVTLEAFWLYDGSSMLPYTMTIQEEIVPAADFTFVEGSLDGNSAIYQANTALVAGGYHFVAADMPTADAFDGAIVVSGAKDRAGTYGPKPAGEAWEYFILQMMEAFNLDYDDYFFRY
jgi:hypothetical protein